MAMFQTCLIYVLLIMLCFTTLIDVVRSTQIPLLSQSQLQLQLQSQLQHRSLSVLDSNYLKLSEYPDHPNCKFNLDTTSTTTTTTTTTNTNTNWPTPQPINTVSTVTITPYPSTTPNPTPTKTTINDNNTISTSPNQKHPDDSDDHDEVATILRDGAGILVVLGLILLPLILICVAAVYNSKFDGSDAPYYMSIWTGFINIADLYTDIVFAICLYWHERWRLLTYAIICLSISHCISNIVGIYYIKKWQRQQVIYFMEFSPLVIIFNLLGIYISFYIILYHFISFICK